MSTTTKSTVVQQGFGRGGGSTAALFIFRDRPPIQDMVSILAVRLAGRHQ